MDKIWLKVIKGLFYKTMNKINKYHRDVKKMKHWPLMMNCPVLCCFCFFFIIVIINILVMGWWEIYLN